jgi:hypothetical protein
MIKIIITLIFTIFNLATAAQVKPTWYQLEKSIKNHTQKDLIKNLRDFVNAGKPARYVSSAGHLGARSFLLSRILELDSQKSGKILEQNFNPDIEKAKEMYIGDYNLKIKDQIPFESPEHQKWKKFTEKMVGHLEKLKSVPGKNIVWEKQGKNPEEVLVLTAHYDTISHDPLTLEILFDEVMPGADYNASGVSVLLGLIKVLSEIELQKTVRIVFLDYQAFGFLGSYHYAMEMKKEKLKFLGVVNLEMLGHDSAISDKTKKKGNMKAYLRAPNEVGAKVDEDLFLSIEKNGKKISAIKFEPLKNSFENSDNIRFWEQGFAALTLSQNWEDDFNSKAYQSKNDFPETLNQLTLYNSYLYTAYGVIGLINEM